MARQFQPPATTELPRFPPNKPDRFWSHFRRGYAGVTVVKYSDGSYKNFVTPGQDTLADPTIVAVYQGGHICPVTDDEAAALEAAGYEVETI